MEMGKEKKVSPQELWLVIGSETSTIGQAAERALLKNFSIIKTSKNKEGERVYLDIANIDSIETFVKNFLTKYPWKKVKVLFLNAGNMVVGDSLDDWEFIKFFLKEYFFLFMGANLELKSTNKEERKNINSHIYNLVLIECLKKEGVINEDTKIIYNSSVQMMVPKKWFEDYAKLKKVVANFLLMNKDLDVTVLALSLVKWSHMADEAQKFMEERWVNMKAYIEENMPEGQPSLEEVEELTEKILEHKQETKGKIVCLDGGIIRGLAKEDRKDCVYFDKKRDGFVEA